LKNNSLKFQWCLARPFTIFSPKIGQWIGKIKDPRQINKTDYKSSVLIWIGAFVFLLQLKASRNIDYKLGPEFLANFNGLFPILGIAPHVLNSIPHHGTVIDFLAKVSPEQLAQVQLTMIRRLIRMRIFEQYRLLDKHYLIAIDATQTITITETEYLNNPEKYRHFLRQKINIDDGDGVTHYRYYLYALEAKLVTPDGLAFSVLTEFIENESQDVKKQDCELKAFYRLEKRLKEHFPKTNLCLLFDSLYAGKPVFDIIKKNKWTSIIRFKSGSIPSVFREFNDLLPLNTENTGQHVIGTDTMQVFRWVNDIEYEGHSLHLLECKETVTKKGRSKTTKFLWICEQRITPNNYKQLSNKGGRCRWKIENQGFNAQKNEGYELEHAYSKDNNAIKCFYILLQIAHIIIQLMLKGNLLKDIAKTFGSIRNFMEDLHNLFTRQTLDISSILTSLDKPFQIRLNSS